MPPKVVTQPRLKSKQSFIAKGRPCRGPTLSPRMIAASAAFAAFRASSYPKMMSALIFGLCASMRAMALSTASTGEISLRRILAASVAADSVCRQVFALHASPHCHQSS